MDVRQIILGIVLIFILGLGYLTIQVTVTEGFDVLSAVSLLVLALFGFGIVGALRHPPE
jgi:hypothetical protein